MLKDFLTDTTVTAIVGLVAFIAGVVLSQRVKDWAKGVPSEVRTGLKNAEVTIIAAVRQAEAEAIAKLLPAGTVLKADPPAAPATPLAPPPAPVSQAPAPAPAPAASPAAPAPAPAPAA